MTHPLSQLIGKRLVGINKGHDVSLLFEGYQLILHAEAVPEIDGWGIALELRDSMGVEFTRVPLEESVNIEAAEWVEYDKALWGLEKRIIPTSVPTSPVLTSAPTPPAPYGLCLTQNAFIEAAKMLGFPDWLSVYNALDTDFKGLVAMGYALGLRRLKIITEIKAEAKTQESVFPEEGG